MVLAPLLATLSPTGAQADASFVFDAVASGDGMTTTAANQSIPLGLVAQASGPTAQAHLTSLPTSDSFASFPYPGQTVAGAPGILGAIVGVATPSYPFIVSSGLGDGTKTGNYPGVTLKAESQTLDAESDALVGTAASGSDAQAQVLSDPNDGVTAISSIQDNGIQAVQDISIAGVSDSAMAHRDGSSGRLTTSSSLKIASIEAPGSSVTLPDCTPTSVPVPIPVSLPVPPPAIPTLPAFCLSSVPGISNLAGQTIAEPNIGFDNGNFFVQVPFAGAPQQIPVPASTVFSSLSAVGITATYQQPVKTTDGIIAGALEFSTDLPAPPSNPVAGGPTHVTYSFGESSASVSLTVIPDASDAGGFVPSIPVSATGDSAAGTPASASAAGSAPASSGSTPPAATSATTTPQSTGGPASGGSAGLAGGGTATPTGGTPTPDLASGTTVATQLPSSQALSAAQSRLLRRSPLGAHLADIYLVLAALGAFAFACIHIIRFRGVRLL